jgi:myosin heavy chain 6/7
VTPKQFLILAFYLAYIFFNWQGQAINAQHEKRQRQFDKLIEEWKRKVSDLQNELDNAQRESRSNAAEAYKFKSQLEETQEVIESLRRDNKNLAGAIR